MQMLNAKMLFFNYQTLKQKSLMLLQIVKQLLLKLIARFKLLNQCLEVCKLNLTNLLVEEELLKGNNLLILQDYPP